jgi:hypothetical protein
MSTIVCTSNAFAPLRLFFLSSLAWDFLWSLGAGSSLLCACVFSLVKCTVEVARGTGRRCKKRMETGVSRWWSTTGAVAVAAFVVPVVERLELCRSIFLRVESTTTVLADHGYRLSLVPFLTLTATIVELKVWTGFFWYRLAQGLRCALAPSLAQY